MRFAKWVYAIAGIYGILVTLPLYFFENQMAAMMPPAINHPEYYYGFVGVTLAWQLAFLVISRDPLRFRPLMWVTVVEKFGFISALIPLVLQGRTSSQMLLTGSIDAVLGVLFIAAYFMTQRDAAAQGK